MTTTAERISRSISGPEQAVRALSDLLLGCEMNETSAAGVREFLAVTGLGARWNHVLDFDRAEYLASVIRSLLPEGTRRLLDVLSGTGTVAAALRRDGFQVFEAERLDRFVREPNEWLLNLDTQREEIRSLNCQAVLVLASLHHESRLDEMLGWLSRLPTERYLIVENLRSRETDAALHARFDWYFNQCLNSFGAECPGWYWTAEQWSQCMSTLGSVRWAMRMDDVPGIPFAYDLFEVIPESTSNPN